MVNESLGRKQEIFTLNIAKLLIYAESLGFYPRLREVTRTKEQQMIYLKERKSKTLSSQHLKSLAADIYFSSNCKLILNKKDLQSLGDYWESLDPDNQWGGNWSSFVDTPHFEMRG